MNLFPIFISLLFCGFLFVYFNTRLAQLKNAIEKQNRVLTSFITNVQNDIRGGGSPLNEEFNEGEIKNIVISANHLASEEAVNAVQNIERKKIVVSDDSESEDSDSEDSDSEDSDSECDENDIEVVNEEIKIIKLQENSEMVDVVYETLNLADLVNIEETFSVPNATAGDATAGDATAGDATAGDANAGETPSFEQMKVDDLRKVVADKGLASKEEVKKLKKPELLVLLKK